MTDIRPTGTARLAHAIRSAIPLALPAALVILVALPALLVLWATVRGPGLSPDSVYYASTARAFAAGEGLVQYDGQAFTWFPPGLPLLLGVGEMAGIDLLTTTVILNAVAASGIVWLTFRITRDLLDSSWAVAGALLVASSSALFGVESMLWTEPLFTLFALLTLRLLQRAITAASMSALHVLVLVLSVGAACAMRYVGVVLIPIVALGVFLAQRCAHPMRGVPRAALVGTAVAALASLPMLGIITRNLLLGAAPMGERARPDTRVGEVIDRTLQTLGSFVAPGVGVVPGVAPLGAIIAVVMTVGLVLTALRWGPVHWLLGAFVGLYFAAIWWAALTTQLDAIDQRLLSPALPVIVIVVLATIRYGLSTTWPPAWALSWRAAIVIGLMGVLLGVSAVNLSDVLPRADGLARTGIGYNHVASLGSPLANAIRALPAGGVAASDPWLAYWVSGRTPMLQVPRTGDHYWSPERTRVETERLVEAVRAGRVGHLALWDYTVTALTPSQLASSGLRLTEVRRFADGTLYAVSAGE